MGLWWSLTCPTLGATAAAARARTMLQRWCWTESWSSLEMTCMSQVGGCRMACCCYTNALEAQDGLGHLSSCFAAAKAGAF